MFYLYTLEGPALGKRYISGGGAARVVGEEEDGRGLGIRGGAASVGVGWVRRVGVIGEERRERRGAGRHLSRKAPRYCYRAQWI